MQPIRRVPGSAKGRSSGVSYGGFGWAVATSETSAQEVGDVYLQTVGALKKLDRVLAEMGADKARLLSATVYMVDINRKEAMDRAWCEWIGDNADNWPQRACVEAGLYKTDLVEIVVLAAMPA